MKRILVIKLSSLGDIAHALPAVHALKEATGAEVDWVTQPEYAGLLACCPDVSRVIEFPRRQFARNCFAFLRALRRDRYEAIVDLQGLLKSAIAARLARGKKRVGPAWAREGAASFYSIQPARAGIQRKHAVEECMDVVRLIAPEATLPAELHLHFPEAEADTQPGPHVALAPFSRWDTKNWPEEKFAELGKRLVTEMGCRIRILGGRENEKAGAALARAIGPGARSSCGQTDLVGLCSRLKGLDLLISVDSGPMHWADAMGVPLVAVFGATDPARTGPYHQSDHVIVKKGLSCRPCHSRTCERRDLACLTTLEVEPVLQAALERL